MPILRTDDSRFQQLPDFDFAAHYCRIDSPEHGELRMHYLDEGPCPQAGSNTPAAPVLLCLHGEPSWCFAYRHVVKAVAAAGFRVVAPGHIGFGCSDKLSERKVYSYAGFVDQLSQFIENLDLQRIVLLAQDWGGPIGLSTLARSPERFAGVLLANTLLPNCEPPPRGVPDWPGECIQQWIDFSTAAEDMPVGDIIASVAVQPLPAEVKAAYDAPFPDASYKAAALAFPGLIPVSEVSPGCEENREVWQLLRQWQKPFATAFSDGDPTTSDWAEVFQSQVPGAQAQNHARIIGAGHFVQEEQGPALAQRALQLLSQL